MNELDRELLCTKASTAGNMGSIPVHDIGWAVNNLRDGRKVTRFGWNGRGQFLGLQYPNLNSANTLPYVYIITVDRQRVPWLASQTDLLATDWGIMPI